MVERNFNMHNSVIWKMRSRIAFILLFQILIINGTFTVAEPDYSKIILKLNSGN